LCQLIEAHVLSFRDNLLQKIRCDSCLVVRSVEPFEAVNRLVPWAVYSDRWEPIDADSED